MNLHDNTLLYEGKNSTFQSISLSLIKAIAFEKIVKKKSVYLGEFLRGWFIESFWSSEDLIRERGGGFVKDGGANAAMSRTRRWKQ